MRFWITNGPTYFNPDWKGTIRPTQSWLIYFLLCIPLVYSTIRLWLFEQLHMPQNTEGYFLFQFNLGTTANLTHLALNWSSGYSWCLCYEGYSSVLPSSFWHSAICFLVWVTGRLHPSDTYDFKASCKKVSARSGSPFFLINAQTDRNTSPCFSYL